MFSQSARLVNMISGRSQSKFYPILGLIIVVSALAIPSNGKTQETGEQLFESTCSACHSLGGGRLVGPDLAGVSERRSQDWLVKFVKSSQSLVKSGDVQALEVFEEFSGMIMPDSSLSDEQITQIFGYVKSYDSGLIEVVEESTAEGLDSAEQLSTGDIINGQDLFQGTSRFENGGPSCNACHEVVHDAVIGGGILAAELTTVFSRMGGSGVGAILGQAPFPVMQAAYKNNALTDAEITDLVAFLQDADEQHLFQQPRDYGFGLFASGAIGASLMYLLFAFIWRGRKRGSVNQDIYDRQIKSELDSSSQ
jgi:mono/diheme cytochrome c family protein